ncbi:MAG: protein-export chaperone SecB [Clostridia bacterium]|nr:protein-export chaperone SecB [Clostridia bacterium]
MSHVQLKAYKVKEFVLTNNVQGSVQLKLSNKVAHNVRYAKNGTCEAVLTVEVFDKTKPKVLSAKVSISGLFQIIDAVEKEFIHVDTFKELFPYAKTMVTMISAAAGIPPIIVQNFDIEKQEIYRFDMNAAKGVPEEEDSDE